MFSVDEFVGNPQGKLSTIVYATKSQLLELAATFRLEVQKSEKKRRYQKQHFAALYR